MYIELLIVVIILVVLVYWAVKKTRLIKWEQAPKNNQKIIRKHENWINSWIKGIGITCCSLILVISTPKLLDFKDVVNKDFQFITGIVVSQDHADEYRKVKRTVQVEDMLEGETHQLYIFYCPYLNEGEVITVACLEHSHYGLIVERQED